VHEGEVLRGARAGREQRRGNDTRVRKGLGGAGGGLPVTVVLATLRLGAEGEGWAADRAGLSGRLLRLELLEPGVIVVIANAAVDLAVIITLARDRAVVAGICDLRCGGLGAR
jgi:hypothetical protein